MSIIAFDSHKRYTFARVENKDGQQVEEFRINHKRGEIARFLDGQQPGSPVAIETIGNWYWIVDEIEQAGMPGVGFILSVVILQEIGDIGRFASAERLASYSGVTPRIHASGGKVRYGKLRPDTNHYLKWAFSEAGNSVAVNRNRFPARHVSMLYNRIRQRKNHAKAVGAVARHLAEATYWVLTKGEAYRDRGLLNVSSTGA
jgi:hypothetical protein